jgi:hypothetical protein
LFEVENKLGLVFKQGLYDSMNSITLGSFNGAQFTLRLICLNPELSQLFVNHVESFGDDVKSVGEVRFLYSVQRNLIAINFDVGFILPVYLHFLMFINGRFEEVGPGLSHTLHLMVRID